MLAYFAPSREPDGVRAPFHDQYGSQGIEYDDDGCIRTAGSVSLHEDIACQNILSAELDTYRTAGRGIVGHGMEGALSSVVRRYRLASLEHASSSRPTAQAKSSSARTEIW
ncbi:hypothetical protein ACFQH8_15680 [Halomicroarcula sp. GCM10025710]